MQGLTEYIAAISITVSASTFDDGSIAHKTFFEHLDKKQVQCLAENIYFEAKNQGTAGWAAVASVTLNRVKDYRYPNTVCEVVKQGPTKESWKTKGKDFPEQDTTKIKGTSRVPTEDEYKDIIERDYGPD